MKLTTQEMIELEQAIDFVLNVELCNLSTDHPVVAEIVEGSETRLANFRDRIRRELDAKVAAQPATPEKG